MFDPSTFRLGPSVGTRVRELREERGWSQRDLAAALNQVSTGWTRAKVGQLEASGVRAEKLTDLATLCIALEVSLEDLLIGGTADPERGFKEYLLEVMTRRSEPRPSSRTNAVDPSRIGAEDTAAEARLAERLGTTVEITREWAKRVFDGASVSQARDALSGIDETTTPREAQAKRGRAMRRVYEAMESGEADAAMLYLIAKWAQENSQNLGAGDG